MLPPPPLSSPLLHHHHHHNSLTPMATCGGLNPLFDNPINPDNPTTLLDSLSTWDALRSPENPSPAKKIPPLIDPNHKCPTHFAPAKPPDRKKAPPFDSRTDRNHNYPTHFTPAKPPDGRKAPPFDSRTDPNHEWSMASLLGTSHFAPVKPLEHKKARSFDAGDLRTDPRHVYSPESLLGMFENRCSTLDSVLGSGRFSPTKPLEVCTEGVGLESSDDVGRELGRVVEDRGGGGGEEERKRARRSYWRSYSDVRPPARGGAGVFPPPISCLGSTGKPLVSFRSFKGDGRFVLREVRIPSPEFLHASRRDGRLKLHFIHTEEEQQTGEEEDMEEQNEENGEEIVDNLTSEV